MTALSSIALLPQLAAPSVAAGAVTTYSHPELAARFDDLYSRWQRQWKADAESDEDFAWDGLINEANGLARLIASQPAITIADIILQAKICALANTEYWMDPDTVEGMHAGHIAFRAVVDSVSALFGTPLLPGQEVFPILASVGGQA